MIDSEKRATHCSEKAKMISTIRRMVLLVSLMFWQGGFMFYGGVVVPVGAQVLGSETQQGFITQSVTKYLNLIGTVCLVVWLEHLWHSRRSGVSAAEWGIWCFAAITLIGLTVIHFQMDRILVAETTSVSDPKQFDLLHKMYIGTSSLQWLASLGMLFLALRRWSRQDTKSASIPGVVAKNLAS